MAAFTSSPTGTSPLPDDLRRLGWLREDLTNCLSQIGGILRRTSGPVGTLPASRVTIAAPSVGPETAVAPLAGLSGETPMHPPASITWVWADGTALVYDWDEQSCRVATPTP